MTINPSNYCVKLQPAHHLPFAFQQMPHGLTQTNTVCFIRPPFCPNSVQPNPDKILPTKQGIQWPVTFPPFFHPPTAAYSVTPVDMMDSEQTGNWIRTLGRSKGWKEAETYVKTFRENDIKGNTLQWLTSRMLESSLGMTDVTHRRELLSTIRSLYPQSTASLADSFVSESHMNTTSTVESPDFTPMMDSNYTTLDAGSEMSYCPKGQQSCAEVLVSPNDSSSQPKLTARKFKFEEHN